MKIVENNVKCGEIIIFNHKFYLRTTSSTLNFVSAVGILSKKFCPGSGSLNENFSSPRVSPVGMVTSQGDIYITHCERFLHMISTRISCNFLVNFFHPRVLIQLLVLDSTSRNIYILLEVKLFSWHSSPGTLSIKIDTQNSMQNS